MQNSEKWEQEEKAVGRAQATLRAYLLSAISVGLALLLRFLLNPVWQDRLPYVTFAVTVIVVTQFAGLGPSIFAIVSGFLLGVWFFVPPRHSLLIHDPLLQFNAAFYFIVCFVILYFSTRARRALARERTARAALGRLAAIIESSEDAIIGKSLAGKVLSWNSGACKLYGYTEGEAVGRSISFLMTPGHENELAPLLDRVGRGEQIRHFETTRLRKDGTTVEVSLCLSPVRNSDGKIVGVSTIARDIADRKRAEQERERLLGDLQKEVTERQEARRALQQSQELTLRQERLAAVGQLAAGLAHEFNNILTIVQGYASLLIDNPSLDEDAIKSVNHITEGVERTAALVKQMLAFSRKQVMQQQVVHIQETMRQIADMLGRLLGKHVELRFDIAPHLPPILADPQMLQQIIANLIVNARDAMSSAGRLTISASEAKFAVADVAGGPDRRPGRFIRLSVSDTGAGMDTDVINHLFEPFFTTKDVGQGCGMGLATVYGMVNQNAGWIEVESTIGQGTTFNIFFPVTENAPENAAARPQAPQARGGGETVLVVEDETVLRELVREILEANGYRVLDAASGREALGVWETHGKNVDLLLTDMAMPDGLSGRDLAARLQQGNPRLPVIFSSGYSQESLQRKESAAPAETFLSKPYQPADLARAVRASLDNAARVPASPVSPNP